MGWGFAVVVDNSTKDEAIDVLQRNGAEAEQIGRVTDSEKIVIKLREKKIILSK